MKILVASLAALFCSIASASTYQMPTIIQLTGHECEQDTIAVKITGSDPYTGYTTGLVYGETRCGGARGGDSIITGCYTVEWAGDTLVLPMTEMWPIRWSRETIPISDCFGS